MYLIDSDRVVDYLNGIQDAIELLNALAPDGLAISVLTYGEVLDGVYYGRDPVRSEAIFGRFLRIVEILPVSLRVSELFARLRGDLRHRGQAVGDIDLLIAATAIVGQRILVTGNRRHFDRVPGLVLHNE